MTIDIKNIINSQNAISHTSGDVLFNELRTKQIDDLTIDFNSIAHVSTAFLNASIGKLAQLYPSLIRRINFIIPPDKDIIKTKISEVIDNALLGDVHDGRVDNASNL